MVAFVPGVDPYNMLNAALNRSNPPAIRKAGMVMLKIIKIYFPIRPKVSNMILDGMIALITTCFFSFLNNHVLTLKRMRYLLGDPQWQKFKQK